MPKEREGQRKRVRPRREEHSSYESQGNGRGLSRPRINRPKTNREVNHPNDCQPNNGRSRKEGRQKWDTKKKVAVAALSVLLALLLGVIGVAANFIIQLTDNVLTEGFTPEQVSIAMDHDFMFDEDQFLTVAIFGDDTRGEGYGRTDTIIIANLNLETNEVNMVSLFRDTVLELDSGLLDKASHAYAFGGSQGAVSMLNRNLDLNIQHYVTVDFTATALVVDALGGVEVDVLWEEIEYINGLSFQMIIEGEFEWDAGLEVPPQIDHPGVQNLCGVQALAYMRIRTVGNNDFRRTERQREVIEQAMAGAQSASLGAINEVINHVFDNLSTNFSLAEILAYGRDINHYHLGEATGFPFDLTTMLLPRSGDSVIPTTLESNVIQLHYFLFGTENYAPSSTVIRISNDISSLTGTTVDSAIDIDGEWEFNPPDVDIPWNDEWGEFEEVDPNLPEEPWTPGEPEHPEDQETPEEPPDLDIPVDPGTPEEPPTEGGRPRIIREQWILLAQTR